jgi:hypothetical protein
MTNTDQQVFTEDTLLTILEDGEVRVLDYSELENFHQGDSWFGCSAGFRAMQLAAETFASTTPWSRDKLYVVSGHPGPGVKDAIELVTGTISTKRFRLLDENVTEGCSRAMKFEWWLSDGRITLHIKLHDHIVPEAFYQLLDRLSTDTEQAGDSERFAYYKTELSQQLWQQSLQECFSVEVLPRPLDIGELPDA